MENQIHNSHFCAQSDIWLYEFPVQVHLLNLKQVL